jgi:hypothetical protein
MAMNRNQRRLALLALGAVFLVGAAPDDDVKPNYWLVGKTDDRTLFYFVDASTIADDGSIRSAWITAVASGTGVEKHGVRRKMTLTIFDCPRRSRFESRIATYDQYGKNLMDHSYQLSRFDKIAPESMDASVSGFVCSNPESWPAGPGWTRITVTPEAMADKENKAFQSH